MAPFLSGERYTVQFQCVEHRRLSDHSSLARIYLLSQRIHLYFVPQPQCPHFFEGDVLGERVDSPDLVRLSVQLDEQAFSQQSTFTGQNCYLVVATDR